MPLDRKLIFKAGEPPKQEYKNNTKPNNIVAEVAKDRSASDQSTQEGAKGPKCHKRNGSAHFAY